MSKQKTQTKHSKTKLEQKLSQNLRIENQHVQIG
jgi:hypothetical protein